MSIIPTPRPLPTPHPDVLCRAVSEGAVLLHTRDEVYFGLNEVGLLIWEMLPPACQSVDEVVERLAARFPEADAAEREAWSSSSRRQGTPGNDPGGPRRREGPPPVRRRASTAAAKRSGASGSIRR